MLAEVGDVAVLKKPHPCGGFRWEIVRAGADYKLRCLTCGHVALMDYDTLKKRLRRVEHKEMTVEKQDE